MTPRVPEEVDLSQNSWGPRTSHGVPDPHILSGPVGREGTDPAWGSGAATCPQVRARARGAAWLPLGDSPTYHIQCGRRKCALPQQNLRTFGAVRGEDAGVG